MNRRYFLFSTFAGFIGLLIGSKGISQESEALKRWNTLTPEQQAQVKSRWQKFRSEPQDRRDRLVRAYKRFQMMPEARRLRIQRAISRRMAGNGLKVRRGWLRRAHSRGKR